jgi:transcriptional regulator with XRE-family HTH domain
MSNPDHLVVVHAHGEVTAYFVRDGEPYAADVDVLGFVDLATAEPCPLARDRDGLLHAAVLRVLACLAPSLLRTVACQPLSTLSAAFGPGLTMRRRRAAMPVEDLAARAGLSADQLIGLEQGRVDPALTTLLRLAAALGVTPAELVPLGRMPEPDPAVVDQTLEAELTAAGLVGCLDDLRAGRAPESLAHRSLVARPERPAAAALIAGIVDRHQQGLAPAGGEPVALAEPRRRALELVQQRAPRRAGTDSEAEALTILVGYVSRPPASAWADLQWLAAAIIATDGRVDVNVHDAMPTAEEEWRTHAVLSDVVDALCAAAAPQPR